jgi:hypothetical protein
MAEKREQAARSVEIDRMAAKLERLPAQRKALNAALREFGEDFDRRRWTAAFESSEINDINRVLPVTGGFLALTNNTVEAVKIGAALVGVQAADGKRGASGAIDAICRDGGISPEQAESLTQIYRTRNALQHASTDVQADEVHRHVKLLLYSLPGLMRSFMSWLEQRGVELR